jgi:plasmid maintenance system antidote protein VapI
MTLDQYLSSDGAPTAAAFASKVGISEASITRIRRGEQNITRDVMLRIIQQSGGKVTPDGLVQAA